MDMSPVLSAYEDEQDKLDGTLEIEIQIWREIKDVLDSYDYELKTRLVDGEPDLYLEER